MKKYDWRIICLLFVFVVMAAFMRIYFAWDLSVREGFSVSGGSDSYYYQRIIDYFVENHKYLYRDPMLNYPIGARNPRPPFFVVSTVAMGYLLLPVYRSLHEATYAALILSTAVWGALSVIPIYLLGKEMFNKRVGIIAALLFTISPAHLMKSVATNADHDSLVLFFSILVFYFFFRAIKHSKRDLWIDSWMSLKKIREGFRAYFASNKESIIYAGLSATSMLVIMLTWQGFPYVQVILLIYLVIEIVVNRLRNQSTFHILMITLIFTAISFGFAYPIYGFDLTWYVTPLILMIGVLLMNLFFETTLKYPWTFLIPMATLALGVLAVAVYFGLPDLFKYIVSGQGYFVKSKLYSTIAEAQPTTIGALVISIGVGVFFLSLAGLGIILWNLRKNITDVYIFVVIYTLISIYMALSAARFIFNAAPAFSLAAAYMLDIFIVKLVSPSEKPRPKRILEKLIRIINAKNVITFFVGLLVIAPNVWSSVDASIPYESKSKYDKEIYEAMPSFWKPSEYNENWYLGAFGYSIPKKTYAWQRAWDWLSKQDKDIYPESKRPAFISWWDYGFESIQCGKHPTVADNFQYGYQIAGQAITAQNETEVIALFLARIIEADYIHNSNRFSPAVESILEKYLKNENLKIVYDIFENPLKYKKEILNNSEKYGGPYSDDISDINCKYVALKGLFVSFGKDTLIELLREVESATGYSIRYFAIDYRLFPFSARSTGIFYAPAKLSDRRMLEARGMSVPIDFYEIKLVDEYGNEYTPDEFPLGSPVRDYRITYKDMFYNSMLYRIFIGYSGKDIGKGDGIPGITPGLYDEYPMQAWNLTHFKLVYRTAFWNPYKDYQNHSDAWQAIPVDKALEYKKKGIGIVELNPPASQILPNDVVIVKFYEGAIVEGYVRLSDGKPLKNVRLTLFDEYGIPHTYTFTDENGYYRLYSIAGSELEIRVTMGGDVDKKYLTERILLHTWKFNVSEAQAMRLPIDKNHDGIYDYYIRKDFEIRGGDVSGAVYLDVEKNGKVDANDIKIDGKIIISNISYSIRIEGNIVNGMYEFKSLPPYKYNVDLIINDTTYRNIGDITIHAGTSITKDFPLNPCVLKVYVTYGNVDEEGARVVVESHSKKIKLEKITNNKGYAEFYIIPDRYYVYATKNNALSEKRKVIFDNWNQTYTLQLALYPSYELIGNIIGLEDKEIYVKIENELTHTAEVFVAKNNFRLVLPRSIYTIYAEYIDSDGRYVFFDNVYLDESKTIELNLVKSYKIHGYVKNNDTKVIADINIFDGKKFMRAHTDDRGYFEIYLPAGTYNLGVVQFGTPYAAFMSMRINSDRYIEISLKNSTIVRGSVMAGKDLIGDGLLMVKSRAIGYCHIINNPRTGNFTLTAPRDFSIEYIYPGFQTISSQGNETKYVVEVVQLPVTVSGYVKYKNDVYTWESVSILFYNSNSKYIAKTVQGFYSIELPVGVYNISVFGSERMYTADVKSIVVVSGEKKINFNISLDIRVQIRFNTNLESINIYNESGELVTTGSNVTLVPGTYSIYYYENMDVFFGKMVLDRNSQVNLPLSRAARLDVQIVNYTGFASISIIKEDGACMLRSTYGSLSLFLPRGTYVIKIDNVREEGGIKYRYYAYSEVVLTDNTRVELNVQKIRLRAELKFTFKIDEKPAGYATLILQTLYRNFTFVADSNGIVTGEVPPGEYSLYAYTKLEDRYYAYIERISLIAGTNHRELSLSRAYELVGGVYIGGEGVTGYITIENYNYRIRVVDGSYYIVLPAGKYDFSIYINKLEYGIQVVYSWRAQIELIKDTIYDIYLKRETIRRIDFIPVSVAANARVGDVVPIVLKVTNFGNDIENLKFSNVNNWNTTFKPASISLLPGETKYLTAYLEIPRSASYGNNTVTIRAHYYNEFIDVSVYINVDRFYDIETKLKYNRTTSEYLEYGIEIKNIGNVNSTYLLSIINMNEILDRGWTCEIIHNFNSTTSIELKKGESKTVLIRLRKIREEPARIFYVKLEISNEDIKRVVEIKSHFAEITISKLNVEGDVTLKVPPLLNEENLKWIIAGIVILVISVGYSLYLRRRYLI